MIKRMRLHETDEERLARINDELKELQETRDHTDNPEVQQTLDAQLTDLLAQRAELRGAIDHPGGNTTGDAA
jgi:hypothetical protein